MTTKTKFRLAMYCILVLFCISAFANWWQSNELRQSAKEQQQILIDAKWQPVRVERTDSIADMTPDVDLSAAAAANTPVAGGVRIATEPERFQPTPQECPVLASPSHPDDSEAGAVPEMVQLPPIYVEADIQGIAVSLSNGQVAVKGKVFATVSQGTWSERRELSTLNSEIAISKDINKALRQYAMRSRRIALKPRSPREWRTGWVAGAGLCADVTGATRPCGFIGYGISF